MNTNDVSPQLVLQQLIQGFQCIHVAAKLDIAELLKDGPRTSEELAQATGTHAPSLYRVLRLLAAIDLLTEQEHSFALTSVGAYLQRGVTGSMHDTVLCYAEKPTWHIWGALLHSVHGEPSPERFGAQTLGVLSAPFRGGCALQQHDVGMDRQRGADSRHCL
jgi:hypothetical protein